MEGVLVSPNRGDVGCADRGVTAHDPPPTNTERSYEAYMTHPTIILWDWNGTLADDGYASLLAVNDILEKRSMPAITMEQYYEYIDTPISKFYEHIFDLNQVTMDVIAREFAEGYARHFHGLHPGAEALLRALHERGVRQVILSSSHRDSVEQDLRRFHIRDCFDAVLGAEDHLAAGKVERGLRWLRQQDCDPKDMVMVGDTLHDYDTACAMGVPCILCAIGHQSEEYLRTTGAPVVTEFSRLRGLLLGEDDS